MSKNNQYKDGMQLMTFLANQFLSTDAGKAVIADFDPKSDLVKTINRNLEVHNEIMKNWKDASPKSQQQDVNQTPNQQQIDPRMMQLALNNDQPLLYDYLPRSSPASPQPVKPQLPTQPLLGSPEPKLM